MSCVTLDVDITDSDFDSDTENLECEYCCRSKLDEGCDCINEDEDEDEDESSSESESESDSEIELYSNTILHSSSSSSSVIFSSIFLGINFFLPPFFGMGVLNTCKTYSRM